MFTIERALPSGIEISIDQVAAFFNRRVIKIYVDDYRYREGLVRVFETAEVPFDQNGPWIIVHTRKDEMRIVNTCGTAYANLLLEGGATTLILSPLTGVLQVNTDDPLLANEILAHVTTYSPEAIIPQAG